MKRCRCCNKIVLFGNGLDKEKESGGDGSVICNPCRKKRSEEAVAACKRLWEWLSKAKYSNEAPENRLALLQEIATNYQKLVREYGGFIAGDGVRLQTQLQEEIALAQKEIHFTGKSNTEREEFAARLKREILSAFQHSDDDELKRRPVEPAHTDAVFEVRYRRPSLDEERVAGLTFRAEELEHVLMDGARRKFPADQFVDKGSCDDGRYRCFESDEVTIFVKTAEVRGFLGNLLYMKSRLTEAREAEAAQRKAMLAEPLQFDQPDEDIYTCFIAFPPKSTDSEAVSAMKKLSESMTAVCAEGEGRFYKTPAKSAKFAIIYSPDAYINQNISELRGKGYKVADFAAALRYMNLEHLWDLPKYVSEVGAFREGS